MNGKKEKKVSLILTTYNCADNLKKTLKSIEIQDYGLIEVVIKDGGSTDGTLDVARAFQDRNAFDTIIMTHPDNGIYDAMNQGYEVSTGEIVAFFNDMFTETTSISKLVSAIEENDAKDKCIGVHADLVYKDDERVIRKWHMGEGTISQGWMPAHPTLFLKREIYEKYGLYDTSYRISADYEFMIRILKDGRNKLAYVPETLVAMFYGGTSSGGLKNYVESLLEGQRALRSNQISIIKACSISIRRMLRVLKQFI